MTTLINRILVFYGLLFLTTGLRAQEVNSTSGGILLTDMLKIRQPADLLVSKDGNTAYFSLTSIEPEDLKAWEHRYQTQLWEVATDGKSAARQLTFSKEGASQAQLSPDETQLVFVRTIDSKPQLFLLPLKGGEARQLTHTTFGASNPVWSPDGKQIAFLSTLPVNQMVNDSTLKMDKKLPEWPIEKAGFANNNPLLTNTAKADPNGNLQEVRAWLQQNEKDKKAKVITRLQFQGEAATSGELNRKQVFIIGLTAGAKPVQVTKDYNHYSQIQFISNHKLLLDGRVDLPMHPDRNLNDALFTINTDGSDRRLLLGKSNYSYSGSKLSANKKWIGFLQGVPGYYSIFTLSAMPVNGNEESIITFPFDRKTANLQWKGDELLYAAVQQHGGEQLLQADLKTKKITVFGRQNEGVGTYSVVANRIVYSKTSVSNPYEIFQAELNMTNEKQLSYFNQEWLAEKAISQPVKKSFTNEKGQLIEYWLMKPTGFQEGKKYPLLLQIHGGPSAMWGPGEPSMWHEFQFWCSKGYGVVYANPRGSNGYGVEFLKANIRDWSKGPSLDVLTALEKSISEGWADTGKLFISGGSYGGYLAASILAQDKRFKAGSSQRGVYDLRTFFGEGNAWRLVPFFFGGYPWQKEVLPFLEKESPINYVDQITTPYIIFHGENDLRTGIAQSEQLFKSLKILERPVEYVRHPGATHELTRSGNNRQRMDQLLRTWEFFERFR